MLLLANMRPLSAHQATVENQSPGCKQVLFSSSDSTSVRGKQVFPESQSGISSELHSRVCVCVLLSHTPLNVHMCAAVLSHLQDR